jgi:flagellar protein FlaG
MLIFRRETMDQISPQNSSMTPNKVTEVTKISKSEMNGRENAQSQFTNSDSNKSPSKQEVEAMIKGLNDFLKPHHSSIQFKLYDKLNEYYVQVVDDQSNQVIQEIPSKKLLDAYSTMLEFIGVLVDKKI